MAITQGLTFAFKDELSKGTHNLDSDTLKIALFSSSATLTPAATTAYSTTNEISGTGYTAGGKTLVLASGYPAQDATTGSKSYRFDAAAWTSASFTARGALIYNSSKSNKAIAILDFGADRTVTASTFTISFPTTLPPIIYIP